MRRVTRSCVRYFRFKADSASQLMAPLPKSRVLPCRPFTDCGLDYAGPLKSKNISGKSKRHYKAYIAIFICFVTKAVHVELVSDHSTPACIATLRRFVSRRGKPHTIHSDCGRNFLGAKKELCDLRKLVQSKNHNDLVSKALADDGVHWQLNPPYAPHFGGLWEAGVKSIKHHLRRVVGNAVFNYEEMLTFLTQVEACLNSRPLSPLSNDPNDVSALTPGHFLTGDALLALPQQSESQDHKLSHINRWQLVQRLLKGFWKRWSAEYLSRLQSRPKWWIHKGNINVNDVVLIKDDNVPPLQWKLGRVVQVHPGADNLVRAVTVKTTDGEYRRAISKLAPLPYC